MNQQPDGEVHVVRSRAKGFLWSLWHLEPSTVAHGNILVFQPGSSLKPAPFGFYGGFIAYARLVKSLDIGD